MSKSGTAGCAGQLWLALLTFLYIDLLDCTGTLLSMASLLDQVMPGRCGGQQRQL